MNDTKPTESEPWGGIVLQRLVRRLWRVITPHRHSIYTKCFDCQMWGINLPDDPKCGNCGSTNTCEYYPTGSPNHRI